MNQVFVAAVAVQDLCRERGWGFCFIGGLAVLRWGEPRLTRDIDLTILAGFGAEEAVVDAGRDRDWLDIEGVVIRQGEDLDRDLVLGELAPG